MWALGTRITVLQMEVQQRLQAQVAWGHFPISCAKRWTQPLASSSCRTASICPRAAVASSDIKYDLNAATTLLQLIHVILYIIIYYIIALVFAWVLITELTAHLITHRRYIYSNSPPLFPVGPYLQSISFTVLCISLSLPAPSLFWCLTQINKVEIS